MTRLSILIFGLVFTGCASLSVHETPARAALGQSAEQEKRDRAECHQKADDWAQTHHLRADTTVCLLARGYALHLRDSTVRGLVSVVVTPAKATLDSEDWTNTTAARDFVACRSDLYRYALASRGTAKAVADALIPTIGLATALVPADDDVRDRFLTCWRGRGYEAHEHASSEGGLEEGK